MGLFDFLNKIVDMSNIEAVADKKEAEILYFKELAFFIAKSYIANTISKCEIKTYEKGQEVQNELYYALNVNPNPNQNSSQFLNKIIEQYYDTGHALVIKEGRSLYCADSFAVNVKPLQQNVFENVVIEDEQIDRTYKAGDVFYFKLDNVAVKTLINGIYLSYTEMFKSALKTYKRQNGKKYKLILDNYKAGDAAFNELYNKVIKAQLSAFVENDNVVYPQFKGTELAEIGNSSSGNSGDIISIRKEIFDTTAQALKIPISMMYGNIQNMDQIAKVYLSICIDPLADMISEELTRKTNTFTTWSHGNYVKVDTSCISHVDILEAADSVSKAVASGAFCVDELRSRFDYPELNTEFSKKHWITKNYESENAAIGN